MDEHLERLQALVTKERQCEIEQATQILNSYPPKQLQALGLALLNLRVSGMRTGMGGKSLVDLETMVGGMDVLPTNKFRTGDIVSIEKGDRPQSANSASNTTKKDAGFFNVSGVITRVTDQCITIALKDELPSELEMGCRLVKLANEISYIRMEQVLKQLKEKKTNQVSLSLIDVLFGVGDPKFDWDKAKNIQFTNPGLNDSQKEAVKMALSSLHVALIHGPPGTGKTYTLIEIIVQLVNRGEKVLVCGPSNISVDNIVERLSKHKLNIVRVGHPARILPAALQHSLDVVVHTSDGGDIVKQVQQEMDTVLKAISKSKRKMERRENYKRLKELRVEYKQRERKVVCDIVQEANVVLSTLSGCGGKEMRQWNDFDTVIIDEATQAIEAESWIGVLKGKKLILAGDHMQLPPTIKSMKQIPSPIDALKQLENHPSGQDEKLQKRARDLSKDFVTLFDRLLVLYGEEIKRMLTIQYRMNQAIMGFSSKTLYQGKLQADDSVKDHLLCDLPDVAATDETSSPLLFIDTMNTGMWEKTPTDIEEGKAIKIPSGSDLESKLNENEVVLVCQHVKELIEAGVEEEHIAIISPYSAQVHAIKEAVTPEYPSIEIGTVDGFQGREKEAVILSLVRSNEKGEVGFLEENRRINVAITRAKRHLCVVGDSDTLSKNSFLKQFCEYVEESGDIKYCE